MMIFSNLLLATTVIVFIGQALASSSSSTADNEATLMAMIDNLNDRYANGKPSNDYNEAGIFLRMIDSICNPIQTPGTPPCDYNLANSPPATLFGGTVVQELQDKKPDLVTSLKNNMFDTPISDEYGDEISIFESWGLNGDLAYGPAAGFIWFPCAAEKATRCFWPSDGSSDGRPLTCSRMDINLNSFEGCEECFVNEGPVLLAEDNLITNKSIGRYDDMPSTSK